LETISQSYMSFTLKMQVIYTHFKFRQHRQWKLLQESYTCIFSFCWTAYMVWLWELFSSGIIHLSYKGVCVHLTVIKNTRTIISCIWKQLLTISVFFILFFLWKFNRLNCTFFISERTHWVEEVARQRLGLITQLEQTLQQRALDEGMADITVPDGFICGQVNSLTRCRRAGRSTLFPPFFSTYKLGCNICPMCHKKWLSTK